jgi:hypothetical protein
MTRLVDLLFSALPAISRKKHQHNAVEDFSLKYNKVFVIGFNKTATSTFHILFQKNGLKSQHDDSQWNTDEYQCFSDNGNKRDWKKLYAVYPNSYFILNTRPLDDWIRSRAKHCYAEKRKWGYPPSIKLYKRWIIERNSSHLDVIRFFSDKPEVLNIVDISQDSWIELVCKNLGIKPYDLSVNEGNSKVPVAYMDEVNAIMSQAMDDFSLTEEERHSPFIVESLVSKDEVVRISKLLDLYTHNLPKAINYRIQRERK